MAKFIGILGAIFLIASFITLIWPRINPGPRPQLLARLHEILMKTAVGKNAANVLGVSDEYSVVPLTPQSIGQQMLQSFQGRVSDVIITHAVREITKRFKDLPLQEQQKVLEEFSNAINESTPSPTQELPEAAQDSTERDNNSGGN